MSEDLRLEVERALFRERAARKQAEQLLEKKSRELYEVNQKLLANKEQLERVVANRTSQLNKASARLTALISGLPAGILVEDEDRRVVLVNSIFCNLFLLDVDPQTLIGSTWRGTEKNAKFLFSDPDRFVEVTRELLANRERKVAVRFDLRDGRILELDFLPLQEGDVSRGSLWMYNDVTDRLLAKEALVNAKKSAEAANKARGQFLAMMSHEMRTPLSAIIGLSDLTIETALAPKQATYLSRIHANADSLLHLIEDILDFSKIDAGQVQLHADEFDPTELVHELGDLMLERCYNKEVELVVVADPQLPKRVTGDKNRIRQILINLVANAIKFTHRGHILVRVKCSPETQGTLLYEVIDTGAGIPKQLCEKIFDRFVKHRRSHEQNIPGTGLGLSISRSLVQMMDGAIFVESTEGVGSRFWFRIPHTVTDPAPAHATNVCNTQSIIVIDDNETARNQMGDLLTELGYQPESFASLKDARVSIETAPPDAVFVDDEMPCSLEVLETLRGNTKLVALCASGVVELERLESEGWAAALPKPLSRRTLEESLKELLGRGEAGAEVTAPDAPNATLELYVLIVEDNEDNRLMLTHTLGGYGYRVDVACDGLEAIARFSDREYDAIITDLSMPKMDGFEMAARIRDLESLSGLGRVPIVAVSAHALPGYRERCLLAGMDGYQTKPVDVDTLDRTVRGLVDTRPVILVVDDSEDHRTLLRAYLKKNEEYRCLYAENGVTALQELERTRVNVLLLDMMMPEMDGYTVARSLRRSTSFEALPIIAMTAHVGEDEMNSCLEAGCSSFLQKPIQKAELFGVIDRALTSRGSTESQQVESQQVLAPQTQLVTTPPNVSLEVFVQADILDMIPRFLENRRNDAENISESLRDLEFEKIQRMGHDMKGSGTSYGFEQISEYGRQLEDAAKEEDALAIERLQDKLDSYLRRVVVHIAPIDG